MKCKACGVQRSMAEFEKVKTDTTGAVVVDPFAKPLAYCHSCRDALWQENEQWYLQQRQQSIRFDIDTLHSLRADAEEGKERGDIDQRIRAYEGELATLGD